MAVLLKNNASSLLAANINAAATEISINADHAALFPTPAPGDWFPLTLVDNANNMEIVRATARSGATITIVRAQEDTTAKSFLAGARVDLRLTAAAFAAMLSGALMPGDVASAAQYTSAAAGKVLTADKVWEAAKFEDTALSGTVNVNMAGALNRKSTISSNVTLGAVSGAKEGQVLLWQLTHSGSNRTLAYNTTYWTTGNSNEGITLSSTSGARDLLMGVVLPDGKIMLSVIARAAP